MNNESGKRHITGVNNIVNNLYNDKNEWVTTPLNNLKQNIQSITTDISVMEKRLLIFKGVIQLLQFLCLTRDWVFRLSNEDIKSMDHFSDILFTLSFYRNLLCIDWKWLSDTLPRYILMHKWAGILVDIFR